MKVTEMNIGGSLIEFYDDYIVPEDQIEAQRKKAIRALASGLERAHTQKEKTA